MPVAFADLGTNMAKLLVGEWSEEQLKVLYTAERYIRLGEGMGKNQTISPGALERMRLALVEFKQSAASHGAGQLFAAGTSALRDAKNSGEAVDIALRRVGVPLEILSGKAEARLTFLGACSAYSELDPPVAVFDIGGGSTEIAIGDPALTQIDCVESLPLGSVRLTEDIAGPSPLSAKAREATRSRIHKVLAASQLDSAVNTLVAGTATANVLAEINGTPEALSRDAVTEWTQRLCGMRSDEILALNPDALKGRADVYPAGILILEALMEYFRAETCLVSPRRMIHGLAIQHLRGN